MNLSDTHCFLDNRIREIERFEPFAHVDSDPMRPDRHGQWVRYSDVEAWLDELLDIYSE